MKINHHIFNTYSKFRGGNIEMKKDKFFYKSIRFMRTHHNINVFQVDRHLVSDAIIIQRAFLSFQSDLLCYSKSSKKKINMIKIKYGVLKND